MRMNAVLSNPKHPEYGQFTVPLPIPHNQYNGIMEALNAMDMGDPPGEGLPNGRDPW